MDAPHHILPSEQEFILLSLKRKATESASAIKPALNHPIDKKIEQTAIPVLSKKREAPSEVDELNAKRKTGRRPNKLVIPTAEQLGTFDEHDYIQIKDGKAFIAISTKKYAEWKKLLIVDEGVWEKEKTQRYEIFEKDMWQLSSLIDKYAIPFPVEEIPQAQADQDFKELMEAKGEYRLKGSPKYKSTNYKKEYLEERNLFRDIAFGRRAHGLEAANYCQGVYRLGVNANDEDRTALQDAPLVAWKDPKKRVHMLLAVVNYVREKANEDKKTIPLHRLKDNMLRAAKTCYDYRPMISKDVIAMLIAKGLLPSTGITVLDTSIGFGGRPLGIATAQGVVLYVGCDPEPGLAAGHNKVLDLIGRHTFVSAEFHRIPSEELTAKKVGGKTFKLLLTSPPYADQEHYSNNPAQSYIRYMKGQPRKDAIHNWGKFYLNRTFYKAYKRLEKDGIMAINIADIKNRRENLDREICMPMLQFLENMGMDYLGCAALSMGQGHEPFWFLIKSNRTTLHHQFMFKSSEITLEELIPLWKKFIALPESDKERIEGFLVPKFWNTVRKKIKPEQIEAFCRQLQISREEYNLHLQRWPQPPKEHVVMKV